MKGMWPATCPGKSQPSGTLLSNVSPQMYLWYTHVAFEKCMCLVHQSVSEAVRSVRRSLSGFVYTLMTGNRHAPSLPAILAADRHKYSSLLKAVSIGADATELAPPCAFALVGRSADHHTGITSSRQQRRPGRWSAP